MPLPSFRGASSSHRVPCPVGGAFEAPWAVRMPAINSWSKTSLPERPMRGLCASQFEQFAVIAGFRPNPKLAAAVQPGYHGHHGDDGSTSCVLKRGAHSRLLGKPDQIACG